MNLWRLVIPTAPAQYSIVDGQLRIQHARSGEILWSGSPDSTRVEAFLTWPSRQDLVIVLTEYAPSPTHPDFKKSRRNLFCLNSTGKTVWQAELPWIEKPSVGYVADSFTQIAWSDTLDSPPLVAWTWSCFRCEINIWTGAIEAKTFTK